VPRPPDKTEGARLAAERPASTVLVPYFFIVPPGVVASPFFSAAPAVLAPWVLASFDDGKEPPLSTGGALVLRGRRVAGRPVIRSGFALACLSECQGIRKPKNAG
jgi:hypothetical protein